MLMIMVMGMRSLHLSSGAKQQILRMRILLWMKKELMRTILKLSQDMDMLILINTVMLINKIMDKV